MKQSDSCGLRGRVRSRANGFDYHEGKHAEKGEGEKVCVWGGEEFRDPSEVICVSMGKPQCAGGDHRLARLLFARFGGLSQDSLNS